MFSGLKRRANKNRDVHFSFNGKYPNGHSKLSLKALENLQRELDARKTKTASVLFRRDLMEHQNKMNYTIELNRIRGELTKNDTRLPIGTREHLENRVKALKKLGAQVADEIK